MYKNNIKRNPVLISTLVALLISAIILSVYFTWFSSTQKWVLYGALAVVALSYLAFNTVLWVKKRRQLSSQQLETEEDALRLVLHPLLKRIGNKPVYLLMGTKGAGKAQFLFTSNTIKPVDKTNSVKNDFFEWYESEAGIYIKPDRRLVFQEVSSVDAALWNTFINEIIEYRPRKPFNGCLLFIDFEFLIVNESEQVEYALAALCKRFAYIGEQTASALPIYLMMSKLDKLDGFKEYIQFSPLKTTVDYLTIPLKDAKGAMLDYFNDSYANLLKVMEANALDASAHSSSTEERKAIVTFPKQFELCQSEVRTVLERFSSVNQGTYVLDIREVFFVSNHQGGRKYNLLAKSCSNYFNLPIIASGYSHLSETPYFTRFLVDAKVLPESEFAGENKTYLRKIRRHSMLSLLASATVLGGSSVLIYNMLESNLSVMNQLIAAEEQQGSQNENARDFESRLANANTRIKASFDAWMSGNAALDKELASLNISRLEESTKLAYGSLLNNIQNNLMPMIEEGYRLELGKNPDSSQHSLALLKGYLMFKDPAKRDLAFLRQQTVAVFDDLNVDGHVAVETLSYIDAYFRTPFAPVDINMDLVRATRRDLLSSSNVDLVYGTLLTQAKGIDLGTLNLPRAIGFDFSNLFTDEIDIERLDINKVYTATGFSTFFRPNVDLMSKEVIADNWVLGLSNHTVPTKPEQEAFKKDVLKKYTDDYINFWRNALSELKVKRYSTIGDLTNAVDLISGPSSPMTTVLKQVVQRSL
ncbi:Intracellular multiplication and macrophage-killing [Enterovibrio nigricans DSM 22720]|uniref:Intracellular multiplication and macrophage-killing n=1 Tax=Enterovibrio nigricans DSM 22720 TaxID=1121868 RepID=A0A1T4UFE3_9GAMM|nr:Intracellular multiplication and macrophage-killing [Enterovibrio nigricans DSM 22720]